jgi:hypothetical protein
MPSPHFDVSPKYAKIIKSVTGLTNSVILCYLTYS